MSVTARRHCLAERLVMLQSAILSVVLFFSLPLYLSSPVMVGGPVSLAPQDVEEKSSPFDGLRWSEDQPEVQVDETWYEPVTIDGIDVKEILAFADQWPPGREKRFAEDFVPILMMLKWKGDRMVDLDLQSLEDGSAATLN